MKILALLITSLQVMMVVGQNTLFKNYTLSDGLTSNFTYTVFQDHQNMIWVGSDAGLSYFVGYHWQS